MFTWVDNPSATDFRPKRIVYTLEPGFVYSQGASQMRLFYKHQSFHDVDIENDIVESYQLLGVSYRWLKNPGFYVAVGNYTGNHIVDYQWDLTGSATYEFGAANRTRPYAHIWIHHVTETSGPNGRDGFTDYAGEIGFILSDGITLFARYEELHDLDHFAGTTDNHVLTGIKYNW
jgi:hypothetical protein